MCFKKVFILLLLALLIPTTATKADPPSGSNLKPMEEQIRDLFEKGSPLFLPKNDRGANLGGAFSTQITDAGKYLTQLFPNPFGGCYNLKIDPSCLCVRPTLRCILKLIAAIVTLGGERIVAILEALQRIQHILQIINSSKYYQLLNRILNVNELLTNLLVVDLTQAITVNQNMSQVFESINGILNDSGTCFDIAHGYRLPFTTHEQSLLAFQSDRLPSIVNQLNMYLMNHTVYGGFIQSFAVETQKLMGIMGGAMAVVDWKSSRNTIKALGNTVPYAARYRMGRNDATQLSSYYHVSPQILFRYFFEDPYVFNVKRKKRVPMFWDSSWLAMYFFTEMPIGSFFLGTDPAKKTLKRMLFPTVCAKQNPGTASTPIGGMNSPLTGFLGNVDPCLKYKLGSEYPYMSWTEARPNSDARAAIVTGLRSLKIVKKVAPPLFYEYKPDNDAIGWISGDQMNPFFGSCTKEIEKTYQDLGKANRDELGNKVFGFAHWKWVKGCGGKFSLKIPVPIPSFGLTNDNPTPFGKFGYCGDFDEG